MTVGKVRIARDVPGWPRLRIPLSVILHCVFHSWFVCGWNSGVPASTLTLVDRLRVSYTSLTRIAQRRKHVFEMNRGSVPMSVRHAGEVSKDCNSGKRQFGLWTLFCFANFDVLTWNDCDAIVPPNPHRRTVRPRLIRHSQTEIRASILRWANFCLNATCTARSSQVFNPIFFSKPALSRRRR